ncbi:MAG: 30S ribosomal protein S2 [Patescibacteria group bacterium]
MQTANVKEVEQLFNLGAHFGHRKSRVHPKSYKYIYKVVNGISIIDLTKTVSQLDNARKILKEQAKEGKKLLVVATKKNSAAFVSELCDKKSVPYITLKWLPGLLTNFETIIENVKKLEEMKKEQESGAWEKYVKHERTERAKQLSKLERFYKGLIGMRERPDVLLVVDVKRESNAMKEAKMYNIPVVAIVDTNANPEEVDHPVIMNDDAPEVVQHVMTDLVETYSKSFEEPKKMKETTDEESGDNKEQDEKTTSEKSAKSKKSASTKKA